MNSNYILGIDPGCNYTAWVLADADTLMPVKFEKEENNAVREHVLDLFERGDYIETAIEMVASYGMPVGREVFETCVWIGRFTEILKCRCPITYIYRKDEKLTICNSPRANDATIKQALVDRFAYNQPNHGKGTKKSPGWFYGFKQDVWAAYAVAVTYHDMYKGENNEEQRVL